MDTFAERIAQTLKEDEGSVTNIRDKHIPYRCSENKLTLGYGRLVDPDVAGSGITEDEAMYLLTNDIKNTTNELAKNFKWWWDMPQDVQEGMIYMCFQLGLPSFMKFKNMLKHLEAENFYEAAEECLDSKWARQTPNRAKRVANLFKLV